MKRWTVAVAAMSLIAAAAIPAGAESRVNVVLMMADDLGWGDTGYNGHPVLQTPHLDSLAREGVRMNRFYAAAPVCSPTRGSCLTGRHPHRYGVFYANTGHLLEEEQSLAELLRAHGYRTGHFGKWHLGTLTKTEQDANRGGPKNAEHFAPPGQHGFQVNFSTESKVPTWDPLLRPAGENSRTHWNALGPNDKSVPYGTAYWSGGERVTENTRGDDSRVIMDRAIGFIEDAVERRRPFFAVIWFHAPHLPVVAGPRYAAMYEGHSDYERNYWGCITAMDEQVGRLRAALRKAGVADDTLLCFCSDNGPEGQAGKAPGSAGPLRGRKRDLYEGGIRVPGIIHWPARLKPAVSELPACTSDYLPTVLAAAEIKSTSGRRLDGVDLLPLLSSGESTRRQPIGFQSRNQMVWMESRWKLVGIGKPGRGGASFQDVRFELYDIPSDPREADDLAAERRDEVFRMRTALAAWMKDVQASLESSD